MNDMTFIRAETVEQAVEAAHRYEHSAYIAGGTDFVGCLRDKVWPEPPSAVIDLHGIATMHGIYEEKETALEGEGGVLVLGALTTLAEVEESEKVCGSFVCLAEAASRTASPLLRNMGTIGGNICQENRCWYYRQPNRHGLVAPCLRKGGGRCIAIVEDSRFHSLFGAVHKCFAVNPSDLAPALLVLDAVIETDRRRLPVYDFFSAENGKQSTVLAEGELVTSIRIPLMNRDGLHVTTQNGGGGERITRSAFAKEAMRKSIDFAIANCAVRLVFSGEHIVEAAVALNGVYNNPLRFEAAESYLTGKELTEETANIAVAKALESAKPSKAGLFKLDIVRSVLVEALSRCMRA